VSRNRYKPKESPYWDSALTALFFVGMALFWCLFGWTALNGTLSNITEALR
jgi:hypothetical protein